MTPADASRPVEGILWMLLTGLCVAECGNGVVEPGELCDDGNTNACGPCNATCSATGAGTCPAGTACNANAVCTSGMCVAAACM